MFLKVEGSSSIGWQQAWQLFVQWNWRSALATPWRTSLTVLGIALGVAVVFAMNAATWSAMDSFKAGVATVAGESNWEVTSTALPTMDETILSPLYALSAKNQQQLTVAPVLEGQALWVEQPTKKSEGAVLVPSAEVITLLGYDMTQQQQTLDVNPATTWVQGQAPTDWFQLLVGKNAVLVGERLAQRHGLQRGSTFSVLINTSIQRLTVAGVLQATGVGGASGGDCIIADLSTLQPLLNQPKQLSRVSLIIPKRLESTVLPKIQEILPKTMHLQPPKRRGEKIDQLLKSYQINLTALSLIALLVGAFLIYNTLNVVMVRRKPALATLLVMGTPKQLLQGLLLAEATLLGAVGSVLGLGLGFAMLSGMSHAVTQTLQAIYTGVSGGGGLTVPSWLPWVSLALGMMTTWVGAYFPTKEALNVQPAEAVRPQGSQLKTQLNTGKWLKLGVGLVVCSILLAFVPPVDGIPLFGYIATKALLLGGAFCLPWIIQHSMAYLQQTLPTRWVWLQPALGLFAGALNRTATACASVMVAIALLVSLSLLIGSFRSSVQLWVLQSLKADLFIQPYTHEMSRGGGRLTQSTIELLRHIPTVEAVDNFLELDALYEGTPYKLGLGRMDLFAKYGNVRFINGEPCQTVVGRTVALAATPDVAGRYGAIISEPFANKHRLSQGSVLQFPTPKGVLAAVVQGIYFDYASEQGYVILPRQLYERFDTSIIGQNTSASVYVKAGTNADTVKTAILKVLPPSQLLSVRTNQQLRQEVLRVFDQTFAITYVMQFVALGIALLSVLNTLWTLVLEAQRDFAILKVLGFSGLQVRLVVLMQALLLALFGGGSGLLMGCGLAVILIHVLNYQSFGWTVPLLWSWSLAWQTMLGVCTGALLGGWIPANLAVKSPIVQVMREQ